MPNNDMWGDTLLGQTIATFSESKGTGETASSTALAVCTWLDAHEKAQVMLASLLVVVGIWWLVKSAVVMIMNLLFPLCLMLAAVVCVPQLREPLFGQNFPALAELLRSILLRLADNLK